jgi:hypothetical protein
MFDRTRDRHAHYRWRERPTQATTVDEVEVPWPPAGDELETFWSSPLSIAYRAALYRVERPYANGDVDRDEDQEPHTHYPTESGRARLADADLPDPDPVAVAEYFADYDTPTDVEPWDVLQTLVALSEGWHTTPEIDVDYEITRTNIRRHLHTLVDAGYADVEERESTTPDRWRATDEGIEALDRRG